MVFWQGFLALSVLAGVFLIWPILFVRGEKRAEQSESRRQDDANLEVYRDHVADLSRSLERGEIEIEEFERLKKELRVALVSENSHPAQSKKIPFVTNVQSRLAVLSLLVVVPLGVIFCYQYVGAGADWDIAHYRDTALKSQSDHDVFKRVFERIEASENAETLEKTLVGLVGKSSKSALLSDLAANATVGVQLRTQLQQGKTPEVRSLHHIYRESLKEPHVALMGKLQARLKSKPDNIQNWYLLGTTAAGIGDYDEAVRAFRELLEVEPNAAQIMAELAQALFLRAGNTITPEVKEYTHKSLKLNPHLPTALGLAGIEAYQASDYQSAINNWRKAVARLNPQSPSYRVLKQGITQAQLAMKTAGSQPQEKQETAKSSSPEPSDGGPSVMVNVALGSRAKAKVSGSDTVFIYARAWKGPKMPLAIQKISVADLPKEIELNKSMAMAPGMDLSTFPQVELVARISASGSAISQSGDWQSAQGPVNVADQKDVVSLTIDSQIP